MDESKARRLRDALKESLRVRRRLEAQIEDLEAERGAPIAVIGMAYRFPGAERGDLWELLSEGREAVGPLPWDRNWVPPHDDLGEPITQQGSFLRDIWSFDRSFFHFPVQLGRAMNPEHRLLLETAWEALEDAGFVPRPESRVVGGIYAGLTLSLIHI